MDNRAKYTLHRSFEVLLSEGVLTLSKISARQVYEVDLLCPLRTPGGYSTGVDTIWAGGVRDALFPFRLDSPSVGVRRGVWWKVSNFFRLLVAGGEVRGETGFALCGVLGSFPVFVEDTGGGDLLLPLAFLSFDLSLSLLRGEGGDSPPLPVGSSLILCFFTLSDQDLSLFSLTGS